ncbi:energy transducer TonB [Myroides odoratus]|uniref:Energy transducer TonB n=1 Tax=Myroides odoratus TaxID=256 RepID=A0A9Q6Z679_MYROD|nr:energy transducer TonB [Myroides odoratus]EHQ43219.1 protein TonB [Myroides odoratus DSM 2801]EKB06604.1 hypothetical protein HMPREF9716_02259 [Myroides odoratus CIP 103059]QQU00562.1 energy transducer TonB [Myroides odoratus]WQD57205.1 energy transducer TonB [Myroides odoratus]STZ30493.1 Gram-negative bacterial tonB protein [Myroides odoratus]
MSKLNIFKKDWVDIIFEGRNKSYGAYQLRSENPKVTTVALFSGIALFGLALVSPMLIDMAKGTFGNNKVDKLDKVIEMENLNLPDNTPPPPPPPPEDVPPPPPPPPADEVKSINDTKKFTEPEIAKKEEVKEEIAKQDDFKEAEVGKKDLKGDKDKGEIKITEKTGEADKGTGSGGDGDGNEVFIAVQVPAEYPGGMQAFNKQFIQRFRTPDIDSGVKSIRVIVMFIVEKDGSLTDIKVVRDPGYGAGKEAVRVLSNMPKWKPAVQNGKTVRSQFTLPITIQVQ